MINQTKLYAMNRNNSMISSPWLTWAPVDYPEPKFHLPDFFGRLDFE